MTTRAPFIPEAERAADGRRDAAWVTAVRHDALGRYQQLGLPTTRDEEWRFTGISPIAEGQFALAHNGAASVDAADLAPFDWDGDRAASLVFVNGRYAPEASTIVDLPAGVRVESLSRALAGSGDDLEAHL